VRKRIFLLIQVTTYGIIFLHNLFFYNKALEDEGLQLSSKQENSRQTQVTFLKA